MSVSLDCIIVKLDEKIKELAKIFQGHPFDFFSEREVHSVFFHLCRRQFGTIKNSEGEEIDRFRQEYNTVWRYLREDEGNIAFRHRYSNKEKTEGKKVPKAASFDFAILHETPNELDKYKIINKDEVLRKELRLNKENPLIYAAIEFKMLHFRTKADENSKALLRQLGTGVAEDCRKMKHEVLDHSRMVVVSHRDSNLEKFFGETQKKISTEFQNTFAGSLTIDCITPKNHWSVKI